MPFPFLKRLGVLGCLLAVCLGVTTAQPTFADGPITSDYFSMDDGGVVVSDPDTLVLARATGAPNLRVSLDWKTIEPSDTTPAQYSWSYPDTYLQRVFDGDTRPIVFVTQNPAWAANTVCGPVDTTDAALLADFAEFMGALAARYSQIKIWILYNEVDSSILAMHSGGCFGDDDTGDINNNGVPDVAEYAIMAGAAREAVHRANPNALVSLAIAYDDFDKATCPPGYPGGCPPLSHMNYHFLPELLAYMAAHPLANGQPYADLLAYTYYDIYGPYWENQPSGVGQHGIQAKAAAIRQLMTDAGVSFPLIVTETGDDSQPAWIGLDGQSRCLTISLVRGMAVDIQTVVWWTFMDNPSRGWYYGLVDTGKNPKPAYTAYQTVFTELNGATYLKRWKKSPQVEGYKFKSNGKVKWVLWSALATSDGKSPCAFPRTPQNVNFKVKRLSVVDLYGNAQIITDNGAGDLNPRKRRMRLQVDGSPKYIILNP